MSFRFSAAHSSRIKKPSKPPSFKRTASSSSQYATLPRRKPIQRSSIEQKTADCDDDDLFGDRMDDNGLVEILSTDLNLRDVAQALSYIQGRTWSRIPEQRAGMNSTRIAEVLRFRSSLPPTISVSHVQALLNSPTAVEREIAELTQGGIIRKIIISGRGAMGEVLIMMKDLETMIQNSPLSSELKQKFLDFMHQSPTALKVPQSIISDEEARALMHAGFITTTLPGLVSTDIMSRPGDGTRGTLTSLNSVSKAASGSLAAVGGEGAVHAAGGSGGGMKASMGPGDYTLAVPSVGPFLKLQASARAHFLSLLSKSKYREVPENMLRQRWDGGIEADDAASAARRYRGDFMGVLPGRTRKWKHFYGLTFEWVLGECVGAGLVEVFDTGSIGRGVRGL